MLIELWRKTVATEYSITPCAICGNDFDLGVVYPMVFGDDGQLLGEMCPTCLQYLNSRKNDTEDWRVRRNWPAREWPTSADLEEARRKYITALFETDDDLHAASGSMAADVAIYKQNVIWSMEPERV